MFKSTALIFLLSFSLFTIVSTSSAWAEAPTGAVVDVQVTMSIVHMVEGLQAALGVDLLQWTGTEFHSPVFSMVANLSEALVWLLEAKNHVVQDVWVDDYYWDDDYLGDDIPGC